MMGVADHENQVLSPLQTLNDTLTADSLTRSAFAELPTYPVSDGISLLEVKNELLLAYLQESLLLLILKLRHYLQAFSESKHDITDLAKDSVKRLTELRVYTDKGVRPLEGRLRYQIDKVIKAANDEEVAPRRKASGGTITRERTINGAEAKAGPSDRAGSPHGSHYDSDAGSASSDPGIDDLSYRPNPMGLPSKNLTRSATATGQRLSGDRSTGAYKPPRIQPAVMPEPDRRSERREQRPKKSALVDEYVASELSSAPLAEPSVGSGNTIQNRGRNTMGRKERADEKERRDYEEANFVRLPGESKADRGKRNQVEHARGRRDEYGGEDWSGLGGLSDRIAHVTGSQNRGNILQRSRKRAASPVEYTNKSRAERGDGVAFEKRRKVLESREARRKSKMK